MPSVMSVRVSTAGIHSKASQNIFCPKRVGGKKHFQIYLTSKLNVLLKSYYLNSVQKFKESSFSFYSSRNPLKPRL